MLINLKRMMFLAILFLAACSADPSSAKSQIDVTIWVDGSAKEIAVNHGVTVQTALDQAGIVLNAMDYASPALYTFLTESSEIRVTRVREEYEIVETIIPFGYQTVKNESLPEGDKLPIQSGENGIQADTYRVVYEDNIEVSRSLFKTEIVKEAEPEIQMIGVQTPFTAVAITGKIAYLTTGNAWVMEGDTANRRPVVTTGDLDGHVFSLSPDGRYLLFTRSEQDAESVDINALWALDLEIPDAKPFSLKAKNIIHYAEWVPDEARTVTYSTVEPRDTAPGWQANNDLYQVSFTENESILQIKEVISASPGGIYGWWGTTYAWSPDGRRLAYARPDSVGLVDWGEGALVPLLEMTPYQTHNNWAWVPGLGWSSDHSVLYTVNHDAQGVEVSPNFDLAGILPNSATVIPMVKQAGMFAYPSASSTDQQGRFSVAYLQAIFPEVSDTSRYRLMVMDRDGSNKQQIYPPEGSPGLEPQELRWEPFNEEAPRRLAVIYQGNLIIVDTSTFNGQQITGDASISRVDWK
ncbi:MAG: G5 domain-containing protein [Anaerolineaceae bacterium]|nr:G5 domain-containing protein [Anaerolineaceae bacterium]